MKDNMRGSNGNKICTFLLNSTVHINHQLSKSYVNSNSYIKKWPFTNSNVYTQLNILYQLKKIDQQKRWIHDLEKINFKLWNQENFIVDYIYWLAVNAFI